MAIDTRRAVGDLVAERIARASVFERFGIDYCCHGQVALGDACGTLGLNLGDVTAALEAVDAAPAGPDETDYAAMRLGDLADQIVKTHHELLKRELPRIQALLNKVSQVHGDRHPELLEVVPTYNAFRDELESHMVKEERVLFPLIHELEAATSLPSFHCGSVKNPIRVMEHEHDSTGSALTRMRDLTNGYATPIDGCTSYRMLMEGLAAVEADIHHHIHKENNILFPKAAELEAKLAQG